ncbi:ABC transporter permease [Bacillus solimangrovi]|uniref:ABC-2 type transporter transmembrane domain-containing protein n=1 Tax=Bacillus solimangrovi TaxID=1305675 RepID=A0A1E5LBB3_9BACI|nr:ABC transporter permease [Bacillus solimangrovi]OEH91366.1 hypothetical protein BFG57_05740 [Bacillus solimangrovi]
MKTIVHLCAFQLKALLRNKKGLLIYIFIPLILLFSLGLVGFQFFSQSEHVEPFKIAIVDHDGTFETRYIINQLTTHEQLQALIEPVSLSEEQAGEYMKSNMIAAMVIIPEDFSKHVARGKNIPIKVIGNSRKPLQANLVRHLMTSAASFASAAQSGINTVDFFIHKSNISNAERRSVYKENIVTYSLYVLGRNEIFVEKNIEGLHQRNLIQYYMISLFVLLIFIWSFSGITLMHGRIEGSLAKRLLSRNISSVVITISNLLSLTIFISVLSVLIGVVCLFLIDLISFYVLIRFIGYMIFSVFSFVTLFYFVHSMINSEKVYQLIGLIVVGVGAVAGGHVIPPAYFNGWVEVLHSVLINGKALQLMLSLFEQSSESNQSILIFLICTSVVFVGMTMLHAVREERNV